MNAVTERKLDRRSGAEGPRHDPYSWAERAVRLNGTEYVLRGGSLGYVRLLVDGKKVDEGYTPQDTERVIAQWERLTGMTLDKFDEYYDRAHSYRLRARDVYVNDDTGDLLRRARRYLAQWRSVPAPSARVAGDSSPQLVLLLAQQVERLQEQVDALRRERRAA